MTKYNILNRGDSYQKHNKYLILLAMLNAVVLATSTVVGYKPVSLFGATEYGTTILFPVTYFLQDAITEVYGYKVARQIVWGSMICTLVSAALLVFIVHLPAPATWPNKHAFNVVLDPMLRVAIASVLGSLLSSFVNIYLLSKWKILVKGKYFWLRSLTSTAFGELILTISSVLIGFIGRASFLEIAVIIFNAFLFKVVCTSIIIYPEVILVKFLKKAENLDVYENNIDFNPFKFYLE